MYSFALKLIVSLLVCGMSVRAGSLVKFLYMDRQCSKFRGVDVSIEDSEPVSNQMGTCMDGISSSTRFVYLNRTITPDTILELDPSLFVINTIFRSDNCNGTYSMIYATALNNDAQNYVTVSGSSLLIESCDAVTQEFRVTPLAGEKKQQTVTHIPKCEKDVFSTSSLVRCLRSAAVKPASVTSDASVPTTNAPVWMTMTVISLIAFLNVT